MELKRNNDQSISLTVTLNGDVQNISGWTFALAIKSSLTETDASAAIYKTATIDNAAAGTAHISFSKDDDWPAEGDYFYDFRARDNTGQERNTQRGTCSIAEIVTRGVQ